MPLEPAVTALLHKLAAAGKLPPEADGVHMRLLSLHDHCLSEAEVNGSRVSFAALTSLQDYRFYLGEEDKFVTLLAFLFRNSDTYYFEPASQRIQPLEGWPQLIDLVTMGLREKAPFFLYIRRCEVFLASGCNLNLTLYFLNPEHQMPFAELAQAYCLHVL